jgi:hypothetical protein
MDLCYGIPGLKTENLGRKLPFCCKIVDGDFTDVPRMADTEPLGADPDQGLYYVSIFICDILGY